MNNGLSKGKGGCKDTPLKRHTVGDGSLLEEGQKKGHGLHWQKKNSEEP